MSKRTFALLLGVIFIVIGIAGFIPPFVQFPMVRPDDPIVVEGMHGRLFALFPVNWLHNVVHLAFGVWGVAAWKGWAGGVLIYLKSVAIIYAVLAVMGFIPGLRTLFGLVPLYGHDIWLHGLIAIAAGYYGWVHKDPPRGTIQT